MQRAVVEGLRDGVLDVSAKAARERLVIEQERAGGYAHPAAAIEREAAAGNDAMNVRVKDERLSPGVKHRQNADEGTELGMYDVEESLSGRAEQDRVQDGRCVLRDHVQRVRNGEDDVEVGNVEYLVASLLEPPLTGFGAATWTVPVAAGVPEDVLIVAAVTVIAVTAQSVSAAVRDGTQHLALGGRDRATSEKLPSLRASDRAE